MYLLNNKIFYKINILILIAVNLFLSNYSKLTIICTKSSYNRTCVYKNIYFIKGKWYILSRRNVLFKCVSIRSKGSDVCWKPIVVKRKIVYDRIIEGLTTYFGLFYSKNIGHLLWDDLYSVYLSLLKFQYKYEPFNIILSRYDNDFRNNWMSDIFKVFSGNKILYEKDMFNNVYLIKELIVGIGHQCQRCVNKEYSICGGKEYKGTMWMRNRMYYSYNITKCNNKYAIVVNNKRFTKAEQRDINLTISEINKTYYIKYIDWKYIKEFREQLKILSCASIYISGPGTGLLNFPFIDDPGIIINVGGLYRGCPSYMEQYIQEGSPHFISLYYPSNIRKYGIRKEELLKLIYKAIYLLNNFHTYKKKHHSNLNVEGKILKNLYLRYPNIMNKFYLDRDWSKENGKGIWAERLIYFPYCYNLSYIVNIVKEETAYYRNELGCNISNSKILCPNV